MIYIHSIALYSGQNKKGLELQHAVNEYDKALFDHFKWEWFTDYLKILMRDLNSKYPRTAKFGFKRFDTCIIISLADNPTKRIAVIYYSKVQKVLFDPEINSKLLPFYEQ